MLEDMTIFHKTYEFMRWLHILLNKFPKSEKYTMAQKIENTALNVLEGIIQSNNDVDKTKALYAMAQPYLEQFPKTAKFTLIQTISGRKGKNG